MTNPSARIELPVWQPRERHHAACFFCSVRFWVGQIEQAGRYAGSRFARPPRRESTGGETLLCCAGDIASRHCRSNLVREAGLEPAKFSGATPMTSRELARPRRVYHSATRAKYVLKEHCAAPFVPERRVPALRAHRRGPARCVKRENHEYWFTCAPPPDGRPMSGGVQKLFDPARDGSSVA